MNQLEQQLNLLVAAQVREFASTIRQSDFNLSGIPDMDDQGEYKRAAEAWYVQNPISDFIPIALQRLQEVDRQIQALLSQRA